MGANNTRCSVPDVKLSLAEKRYKVNGIKRRSTRKTGNVTANGSDMTFANFSETSSPKSLTDPPKPSENLSTQIDQRLLALYPIQTNASFSEQGRKSIYDNPNAPHVILLTRTERVLIEKSFKRQKKTGSDSIGARVFLAVLTAQPDIKILFGLEKVHQGRLKYDPRFRKHASLLTRALDYIVKNLAYTDKLSQHFCELGKKHCELPGRAYFPQHYWDTFAECIIQSVCEFQSITHRCRETSTSWRNLITFIIKQMRRGYEDEKLFRKRFSASLICISSSRNASLSASSVSTTTASARSYRALSDCRTAVSWSLNSSLLDVEKRQRLKKRTSSMNIEGPVNTLKLPAGSSTEGSTRSASWCSEQKDFDEQFRLNALRIHYGGYTTPNLSNYENGKNCRTITSPKRCLSMPSTHQDTAENKNGNADSFEESVVQLRVYNENGSLASICEALANLGKRALAEKNAFEKESEEDSVNEEEEEDIFVTPRSSRRMPVCPYNRASHSN